MLLAIGSSCVCAAATVAVCRLALAVRHPAATGPAAAVLPPPPVQKPDAAACAKPALLFVPPAIDIGDCHQLH